MALTVEWSNQVILGGKKINLILTSKYEKMNFFNKIYFFSIFNVLILSLLRVKIMPRGTIIRALLSVGSELLDNMF